MKLAFKAIALISMIGLNLITFAQDADQKSNMKGLRTTIYQVNDINAAKQWYSKAFNTDPYFDEPFYVGFNIGGYELGLQPDDTAPDIKTKTVISYWGVDDIQKTYDFLLSIGAKANEKPTNVGGAIMTATVLDPWGNILGIIYNPEFTVSEE
ncbi:MAG: VOC family protein [Cytophagales bacterium]|nr:VOC family protein [Cytophagales bacterium]